MTASADTATRLLVVAVGPVQNFIAAARRTQDFNAGSEILSQLSRAGAAALRDRGASLVFPTPAALDDPEAAVANKLLAEIKSDVDPELLATVASDAIRGRWLELAREGLEAAEADGVRVNRSLWDRQVRRFVEVYAAWTPVHDERCAYGRVELLLAGRKALRDFDAWIGPEELEKSSLDGAGESVILDPGSCALLRRGEALDSVGLSKRFFRGRDRYPSVTRVAADPFVRALAAQGEEGRHLLQELDAALGHPRRAGWPEGYKLLVDDASALYADDENADGPGDPPAEDTPGKVREISRRIRSRFRLSPSPYYAIVRADGDRMGACLDSLPSMDARRFAAQLLTEFARRAREIVRSCYGVPVYAGGDDVLAFAPVDTALSMAQLLHREFGRVVGAPLATRDAVKEPPTLSVGVVVGHHKDDMVELIHLSADAEHCAKDPGALKDPWCRAPADDSARDGLCIMYRSGAGGGTVTVRSPWAKDPVGRLTEYVGWLQTEALSTRTAYDLAELARMYDSWERGVAAKVIPDDLRRLLARKRDPGQGRPSAAVDARFAEVLDTSALLRLAHELLLAGHLAATLHPFQGLLVPPETEVSS